MVSAKNARIFFVCTFASYKEFFSADLILFFLHLPS